MFRHIISLFAAFLSLTVAAGAVEKGPSQYVDPSIGLLRGGHVVVGPCAPFGMVKPSPDVQGCNPGWGDMSKEISGFSQLHVSGTGGSPKYGNVLIMPFISGMEQESHESQRLIEKMKPGYYSTLLAQNIKVEITSSERAAFYRLSYPKDSLRGLEVDAGFVLKNKRGGGQQNLGGQVQQVSDKEICGWTTARGGWGSGDPYTVYFSILSDTPIINGIPLERQLNVCFAPSEAQVLIKVGISFISIDKARENALNYLPDWDFEAARKRVVALWDELLGRVTIDPKASLADKRMFYTALYHSMLMPSDRTGEWEKALPDEPYYDDYFTLWDIYRCTIPLVTLIDSKRGADMVQSLINICKYDGFMPDGRSGNSNGSTQGSSNADIVIADAFVKGLDGIDYEAGLQAMLKDATVTSDKERREGRVGLQWYNTIGYLPWGVSRAGSRTVDHTFCDYAISVVAEGLGEKETAEKYREQSHRWLNLFRKDFEENGMRGFIMPRDENGNWLDEGSVDKDGDGQTDTTFHFRPSTSFGSHWNSFFYEANCYETSLCVPHDMDMLIEECGGPEAFKQRLDLFFSKGWCDMGNEPSFLSSCLYHWIGRPDLSSDIIAELIENNFSDGHDGIPGNDDSGAMSSWLAFHMAGLYPFAGTGLYLIHTPRLSTTSIRNADGTVFTIKTRGLSPKRRYIRSARLNGKRYPYSTIRHEDIVHGGRLVLRMSSKPGKWGKEMTGK